MSYSRVMPKIIIHSVGTPSVYRIHNNTQAVIFYTS